MGEAAHLGGYGYPQQNGQSPVYYYPNAQNPSQQEAIAQAVGAATQNNDKKRAFEGVDQLIEDAKRNKIQPVYDGAMAQRLSALQHFVPATSGEFNGSNTATASAGDGDGPQFQLPSLRTKQDLIDADHFFTQLSADVYDQSAVAQRYRQPGSPHVHSPNHQPRHSPQQPHTPGNHDNAPAASMAPANSGNSNMNALTPPTSNYTTSNGSPQHHHTTPPTVSPQASGASMYPALPAVTVTSSDGGYPAPVSSAPTSSLGPSFETERRRIPVGVLQKAKPIDDDNDVDMDCGGHEEAEKKVAPAEMSDALIDPNLAKMAELPEKPMEPSTAEEEKTENDLDSLNKNIDIINSLHAMIRRKLEESEEESSSLTPKQQSALDDMPMPDAPEGVDSASTPSHEMTDEEQKKQNDERSDAEALYPVLRAVAAC